MADCVSKEQDQVRTDENRLLVAHTEDDTITFLQMPDTFEEELSDRERQQQINEELQSIKIQHEARIKVLEEEMGEIFGQAEANYMRGNLMKRF